MAKSPDDIELRDVRVRLDSDNAKRYTEMADAINWPREVLVNHLLRSIETVIKSTAIAMKSETSATGNQKQIVAKRQSTWSVKL